MQRSRCYLHSHLWRLHVPSPGVQPTLRAQAWVTVLSNQISCRVTLPFLTCTLNMEFRLLPRITASVGRCLVHKIIPRIPQKAPVPWHMSAHIEEKASKAKLLRLQDPVENISQQVELEIIIELKSVNSCFGRKLLFPPPPPCKSLWSLGLPFLTELADVQEGRAESAQVWRWTEGKPTPGISSVSYFTAQTCENFPHFAYFLSLSSFSSPSFFPSRQIIISGILRGKCFFSYRNNFSERACVFSKTIVFHGKS